MKRATKEEVQAFSDSERTEAISTIFNYWREQGFPEYKLSRSEIEREWKLLYEYDRTGLIDSKGNIKQTMHGLGLAWNYFPHHWGVSVNNKPTVLDIWNSDELFKKAIGRRLNRGGMAWTEDGEPAMTVAIIRKALMACSSAQRVSNFRPTASASIYDRYAGNGVVWDMSCGYGGRLLGAIISSRVSHYIGCEPATLTYTGLQSLTSEFAKRTKTKVEINQIGSEDFVPSIKVDLAFTSPPYFNTEKYSDEETQSYKKFSTTDEWDNGFLRQTVINAHSCLNPNRYLLLNVANVKSHPKLVRSTITIAEEEGFEFVDELHLLISAITQGGYRYEPVLVFQKN